MSNSSLSSTTSREQEIVSIMRQQKKLMPQDEEVETNMRRLEYNLAFMLGAHGKQDIVVRLVVGQVYWTSR
jgi:hypothetical protein